MHHRVAEIVHHHAMLGDRTHQLFEAAGSPRPGGIMVSVFLCMLLVCLLCCARFFFYVASLFAVLCTKWQLVKILSTSSELGCRTVGLMGLKHISYVGFSIENKMADLNLMFPDVTVTGYLIIVRVVFLHKVQTNILILRRNRKSREGEMKFSAHRNPT